MFIASGQLTILTFLRRLLLSALPILYGQPADQHQGQTPLEQSSGDGYWFVFSKDKSLVAGGLQEVKVWDVKTGHLRMKVRSPGVGIALSSDAKTLAVPTHKNEVALWALSEPSLQQIAFGGMGSGNLIRVFNYSEKRRFSLSLAFSPDLKLLASGNGDDTVTLWDFAAGKEQTLHQQWSNGVAIGFSQDGKSLASGGRDGTVRIWDVAKRSEVNCIKGFPGQVERVAFGDSDRVIVAAVVNSNAPGTVATSTVFLNQLPKGEVIAQFAKSTAPVLTHDGRFLATISDDGDVLTIWNRRNSAQVYKHSVRPPIRFKEVEFVSENKIVCVMTDGKKLSLLHLSTDVAK